MSDATRAEKNRSVTLAEVVRAVDGKLSGGNDQLPILDITHDSRQVKDGTLFVAIRGELFDAHKFVPQVLKQGAAGIVSEFDPPEDWRGLTESQSGSGLAPAPWIKVSDVRRAMALAAATVHRHPSRELQLAGITGTNGKTTDRIDS
jgi:UDP-N-acetylmuramoyl-L-alanyl-D-glutamate--2,6-diaminopimelate ligase